ncbi:MAG: hypothetical protein IJ088_08475 [Clostridia bacterium]|nr:hypothetical protein [Clostridia bacterium]
MLIKLIKYDLRAMGRLLAPISGVLLILSVVLGFNLRGQFDTENWTLIPIILGVLIVFLVFFALMLTFVLTISRFKQNLFGNQGYLSFALPVSTAEHIAGKFIASFLWFILIAAVSCLSFYLVTTISTPALVRKLAFPYIRQYLEANNISIPVPEILLATLTMAIHGLFHLYAAICIGHLWQKHSTLLGIIAYVVLSVLTSRLLFYLSGTPLFAGHYLTGTVVFYLVFSAIYAFICWIVLERHLNLD